MSVWAFVTGFALLVLNGFFVAVEFSLVASRRSRLEQLASSGDRRATLGLAAVGDLTLQLAGAQLGITAASLALGYVAEPAVTGGLATLIGPSPLPDAVENTIAVVLGLGLVVFLHLVIGEMVPKGIALADPERTLLWVAVPNHWYVRLLRPVMRMLNASSNVIVRALRVEPRDELSSVHTAQELAVMVAESHEEGVIEDFAHDLLTGVLDFGGRDAGAVMIPRHDIVSAPRQASAAEIEDVVVATGHSRIPLTGPAGIDDIVGFVHSKDLLRLPDDERDRPVPDAMCRTMQSVGRDQSLEQVLVGMQWNRIHVVRVRADDDTTAGLLTLEDLLEELVGDILDESDHAAGEAS